MGRWRLAATLLLLWAGVAEAQQSTKKKLAVLEFGHGAEVEAKTAAYMVDVVRGEAVKLPDGQFLIMTKENILEMLPPETDLASCEGACEVETGRNIGADYLITGEFIEIGGEIKASMRLYDTASGSLKASEKGAAKGVADLESVVMATAGRLMKPLGHPGPKRNRTFGADLPKLEGVVLPTLNKVAVAPTLGGLGDIDVGMLQKYETAKETESAEDARASEKAAAWRVLEMHKGVSEEMRAEAKRRAEHWEAVAEKIGRRCLKVRSVAGRYAADKKKFVGLMKLKDSTLPRAKKDALKAEFDEAYGPWREALEGFERDCSESVIEVAKRQQAQERALAEWQAKYARGERARKAVGVELIKIPGGTFSMGADDGSKNERPVHRVTLPTFWISKNEITVRQYKACVSAGQCNGDALNKYGHCNWGKDGREDHPMNCVNWNQASDFAEWVNGRLPTEAEWEFAARSGGKPQAYPWGDEPATCSRAVMASGQGGCGQGSTGPVCKQPGGHTAQGVCDMAGNVWEWVEDVYVDNYKGAPTDGSARMTEGPQRVFRGGGWADNHRSLRAAKRRGVSPRFRDEYLGFRLVLQR